MSQSFSKWLLVLLSHKAAGARGGDSVTLIGVFAIEVVDELGRERG